MASRSTATPLLELRDVTFRQNERLLFPHTQWRIRRGETWAVIGRNGSGKSTFVRGLRGELPAVEGEIVWRGTDAWAHDPERVITVVSFDEQRTLLDEAEAYLQARWNTVGEDVSPTVHHLLSRDALEGRNPFEVRARSTLPPDFTRRRRYAIRTLGLKPLLSRRIAEISNGERRRLVLARALIQATGLLVLDNPLTGLDANARAVLSRIFRRVVARGTPLLFVTARAGEIPRGVTHLLAVDRFRIVAQGPRRSVLRDPAYRRAMVDARGRAPRAKSRVWRAARQRRPGDVLFEIRHASVTYGRVRVLRDVSWRVRAGEQWALLGHNGAGKTTLLSLLTGDNPQAYANDVRLFGRRRGTGESIWDIKRRVGIVSPEVQLYFRGGGSAFDVVCSGFHETLGLYRAATTAQRNAAQRCMRRLDVLRHAGDDFSSLSEGGQRLVLLARAMVKKPALLVLDEPCQGLDAPHRARFLRMLEHATSKRGPTMLYITHLRDELPVTLTHILRLARGQVLSRSRA